MANEVAKNPKHFAGFASLSMHDPHQAATELRRAVKDLGLKGAILNDYQSAGPDGEQMLMYDQPTYDPFWNAVQVCAQHNSSHDRQLRSVLTPLAGTGCPCVHSPTNTGKACRPCESTIA